MHAWDMTQAEINFDNFSALIAVGGDGTLHEVINGMMARPDSKRLPVAFVPAGTGNDLVGCLGIRDADMAIDWFLKGDVIKMDLNKIIIDAQREEDIPPDERTSRFRYSAINTGVGFVAKSTHKAIAHKPMFGGASYATSGFVNFFTSSAEVFDLEIELCDGSKINLPDEESMVIMANNGRFGGGRIPFTPAALLNDGLFDLLILRGQAGVKEVASFVKSAVVQGGHHVYKPKWTSFRGTKVVFTNKNYITDGKKLKDNSKGKGNV